MKNKLFAIICIMFLAILTGCTNEKFGVMSSGRLVRPVLSSWIATKSMSQPESENGRPISVIPISENPESPLYMIVYEKDMPEIFHEEPATKGTEVTTSNLNAFRMKAYAEHDWHDNATNTDHQAGEYFGVSTEVTVSRSSSEWTLSPEQNWLNDVPISFWSWNEVEPAVYPSRGYDMAFFSYSVANAVTSQKDLVFAYNGEKTTFNGTGSITAHTSTNRDYARTDDQLDIHFYHALSAIKFDISGVEEATLGKITLKGIYPEGDCDITVSDDGVPEFEWTVKGKPKSYSQTFDASDFGSDGKQVAGGSKEFLMIPQTLRNDAAIEITLTKSSDPTDVIKESMSIAKLNSADPDNVEWKAGKYYTYRLTTDPFAYDWEYRFALPSPDDIANPTVQTVSYVITNDDVVKYIDISSLKVRQDKPSVGGTYGYHIKSYQVGNGSVQPVDGTFSDEDAGLDGVIVDEQNRLVLPISAKELLDRGTNRYWYDLTDGSDWHPADWVDETESDPIDLSRMDYRTDDISQARNAFQMSTANCYVIRHAGWYKLPLVYGNAMLNGSPNVDAYAPFPSDHDDDDLVLGVFKNHLDQEITSPFIENNAGCDASTCEVLWQANGNAVQQLSIEGTPRSTDDYTVANVRYLKFYMDPTRISQNNSLIAIKDDQGRVIWSWQIWSTNDPLLLEAPIEVTSYAGNKYWFFQIPSIGRIINDEYPSRPDVTITLAQDSPSTMPDLKVVIKQPAKKMDGEYVTYQFGCKNPIRTGKNVYSYMVPIATAPVSLGTLIQNPGTFYTFPSSDRYATAFGPKYKNLWSGKDTQVTGSPIERTSDMIKTIYDPSPIGYKVPASGAYSGFTTTGVNSFWRRFEINATSDISLDLSSTDMRNLMDAMGGINLYTSLGPGHTLNTGGPAIWFPKDGMRPGGNGKFSETTGMYYTCNFMDMNSSYAMLVGSSLGVGTASPCNGHNVRCVTDPGFTPWWTSTGAPN